MEAKGKILEIAKGLENKYGKEKWEASGNPLETLIKTILSQNTNDRNRDKAYQKLKEEFSTYRDLGQAPKDKIAEVIKPGGLHNQKASRIKGALNRIKKKQGKFSLDYLRDLPLANALEELISFEGVGKKTAGIVLIFCLKKPYFPVDTHVKRQSIRLGLVKENEDPHDKLNPLIPDEIKYQLHLHFIRYGREICKARNPRCDRSIFRDICKYYKETSKGNGGTF